VGKRTRGRGLQISASTRLVCQNNHHQRRFKKAALMSHILVIESDRNRRTLLMGLIRQHTRLVDVTLVDSVQAAIACFANKKPDLIVAPTLLSPDDSAQLTEHVKWYAAPHVQMLTVPALDMLRAPIAEERHRFSFFRRRRPVSLGLQYDPSMVGRQIADALDVAVTLREERGSTMDVRALLRKEEPLLIVQPSQTDVIADPILSNRSFRERAERMAQSGWSVRMPWGSEVDLVNISRTGVLLESNSKVSPGVILELNLKGMGQSHNVMARFVRSQIADVDRLGVRYHAAAHFEQPLEMLTGRTESNSKPQATPQSLAALFSSVVSESDDAEDPCLRFTRGLCGMVGARDVLVRQTPMVPSADCESIYFRVNGDERSGMVLQILFDRHRSLTTSEFRLLKAATGLTSALLDLDGVTFDETALVKRKLAQVA